MARRVDRGGWLAPTGPRDRQHPAGPGRTARRRVVRGQRAAHGGFDIEVADLAEIELPFMDEPNHPRLHRYIQPHTLAWSAQRRRLRRVRLRDARVQLRVHAPLKNAIDYLHQEWHYKPVGFVSYGGVAAGTRAAQMVRQIVTAVRMVPVVETVSIPFVASLIDEDDRLQPNDVMISGARAMLDELVRMESALRPLRG